MELSTEQILGLRPLIRLIAGDMASNRQTMFDMDDFMSIGMIAALEAAPRFDGKVKLSTYMRYRIKGAMWDAVRQDQLNPLSFRRDQEGGWKVQGMYRMNGDPSDMETYQGFDHIEASSILDLVWSSLTKRDAWIIQEYFWKDRTQESIAGDLGISQSYIYLVIRKALKKLRAKLRVYCRRW